MVTIVVLIILATISVNAIFGENGLIKKASQSKETHLEAQAREKLSFKIGEYRIEIYEKNINDEELKDSYLCTKLSELGPTQEATDNNYYDVIVDGYVFWVKKDNQEIVSKGKDNTEDATKVTASNMEVKVGQTSSISMTIEPEGASTRNVTYKSSDVSIATVSNGTVTGVGKGTATITIKTKGGHEETFAVTVSEVEVESISLEKTTLTVGVGKTSEALVVTFTPANATNKTIEWSSNSTTVATVDKNTGVITGVAEGTATITATSANGKTATCSVTVEEGSMTIAEAKAAVTSYATLKEYIGTKVTDYNPEAGGTWRIFYYDAAGDFGPEGKLYLKRDYDSRLKKNLSSYASYTPSEDGLNKMKAMNPKWSNYPTIGSNTIDLINERAVSYLCDGKNWSTYLDSNKADSVIGSPSVEMYMKAFNVWKTGNKDATNLVCKVESANGYSVGANGTYDNSGSYTNNNTIEPGPNNIFMTSGSNYWCLASPSSYDYNYVPSVHGDNVNVDYAYIYYLNTIGVCPVVSL